MNLKINRIARRAAQCAGIFAIGIGPAASGSAHHLEKHFTVQPRPVISLHNPSGTITIKSWTKPAVQVIADHASDKVEVDAVQNGNRVDLLTHLLSDNAGPDDLRADYQITVPEDAELQIHNDSGSVAIGKILGDTAVDTVAAGVDLQDIAGYLTVRTVDGSFQCARCSGRIEVTSISGNLKLLENHSSNVRIQTTRGNVSFDGDFLPNGLYVMKNYSGVIEVRFSPADSFDLSATSLQGRVFNEANLIPPAHNTHTSPRFARSLFGSVNQGRAKVEVTSFSGTINIRKRE
jgi:DUF4097 and DUF4098 domain-containing protein YvlB